MRRLGVSAALVSGSWVKGDVIVSDGLVAEIGVGGGVGSAIAVPGLVDLQVNGAVGVDLRRADRGGYESVGRFLAGRGVTAAQPTFYSQSIGEYCESLTRLRVVLEDPPAGTRWWPAHMEGPFLSPLRRGAHLQEHLIPCDLGILDRLLAAGPVGMMTIAPELDGAPILLDHLSRHGVVSSIGHSDANSSEVIEAVERGARHITHCWNATRPVLARDPGPVGIALTDERLTVGIIADLVHVDRSILALSATAASGRLAATADSIDLAGLEPDNWPDVPAAAAREATADGAARLEDGTIAGGTATPDACLRNLVSIGVALEQALDACSGAQRRLLERAPVTLRPGEPAELVVLDDGLVPLRTTVGGAWFEPT